VSLVLASGSPRRRELLRRLGLEATVVPSAIPERDPSPGEPAETYALCLAQQKAAAVARRRPDTIVIAADTVVALDGLILNKPSSKEEAACMLGLLRGRWHRVATAVVVCCGGEEHSAVDVTRVHMRSFDDTEMKAYIATGEPFDKAGAYGVQGAAGAFVDGLEGCFNTVVGLPLARSACLLRSCGLDVPVASCCPTCDRTVPGQRSSTGRTQDS
jgi:septum formation protein